MAYTISVYPHPDKTLGKFIVQVTEQKGFFSDLFSTPAIDQYACMVNNGEIIGIEKLEVNIPSGDKPLATFDSETLPTQQNLLDTLKFNTKARKAMHINIPQVATKKSFSFNNTGSKPANMQDSTYWYKDSDCDAYIEAVVNTELGGFAKDEKYRLNNTLKEDDKVWHVLITPSVNGQINVPSHTLGIDYFLNKTNHANTMLAIYKNIAELGSGYDGEIPFPSDDYLTSLIQKHNGTSENFKNVMGVLEEINFDTEALNDYIKLLEQYESRDVFDEINDVLEDNTEQNFKILFQINLGQYDEFAASSGSHWITGEIQIIKNEKGECDITIFGHDPAGGGILSKENHDKIKNAVETRLREINLQPKKIPPQRQESPYKTRRQYEYDSTSCGVISCDDLPARVKGQPLNTTYGSGAVEARNRQAGTINKYKVQRQQQPQQPTRTDDSKKPATHRTNIRIAAGGVIPTPENIAEKEQEIVTPQMQQPTRVDDLGASTTPREKIRVSGGITSTPENIAETNQTVTPQIQQPVQENILISPQKGHTTDIPPQMKLTISVPDLQQKSDVFFNRIKENALTQLPETNRIKTLIARKIATPDEIANNAANTRPVIHAKTLKLIEKFIAHKQKSGSDIEKEFYKTMTPEAFMERLLTKRPLMFMLQRDSAILRDGTQVTGGFETIGTSGEKLPLVLADYISYDEMQIAALMGVSVPTHFINKGGRNNNAIPDETGNYEKQGIYVGLVGARFEKPGLMEYQHMLITRDQNTTVNGYGDQDGVNPDKKAALAPFAEFYGQTHFPTYEEAEKDKTGKYIKIGDMYLNRDVYKERLRMVIEPFLADANDRAQQENKKAYVQAVGLGLGVWAVNEKIQAELMLEVYNELLQANHYEHISDVDFSWFPHASKPVFNKMENTHKNITLHYSKRDPAEPLNNPEKLLVAMYAWDGNSYPGNEYYAGMLSASGDPAAASCSAISELQNPEINTPAFKAENIKVYGREIKPEIKKVVEEAAIAYDPGEEKIFILTQDMARSLYAAVPPEKQDALNSESNAVYPQKITKALQWLDIQVDWVAFNGTNGYRLKINKENIDKIEKIHRAPKVSEKVVIEETKEKPSFEQWLRNEHKVAAKSENTQKIGGIRYGDYINYLFNSREGAENFAVKFGIGADYSRFNKGFAGDQKIFKDPLNPGKFALLINKDKHADIKMAYENEIKKSNYKNRPVDEIQTQIDAIDFQLQSLQQKWAQGRLDKLNGLATNKDQTGWYDFEATSSFQLSLQNYIALNMDTLSKHELEALQETSRKIMGDKGDVSTGLKQDENWYDYVRNSKLFTSETIITPIQTDAKHLLLGEEKRIKIDNTVSFNEANALLTDDPNKQRIIPRFLPGGDENTKKTDEILITSGGMAGHRTITKIWKQENPEAKGEYDYFQTEYNAGAGSDWKHDRVFNPETKDYTTGVSWVVTTKKIKPGTNIEKTLENLIVAQRMIMNYKEPEPDWYHEKEKRLEGYSEKNSKEAKNWKFWKDKIDTCLESRDEALSKTGAPQLSGNCSAMSLKVYTDDYCENKIGSKNNLEEHWRHIKANGHNASVDALKAKKDVLLKEKSIAENLAAEKAAEEKAAAEKPASQSDRKIKFEAAKFQRLYWEYFDKAIAKEKKPYTLMDFGQAHNLVRGHSNYLRIESSSYPDKTVASKAREEAFQAYTACKSTDENEKIQAYKNGCNDYLDNTLLPIFLKSQIDRYWDESNKQKTQFYQNPFSAHVKAGTSLNQEISEYLGIKNLDEKTFNEIHNRAAQEANNSPEVYKENFIILLAHADKAFAEKAAAEKAALEKAAEKNAAIEKANITEKLEPGLQKNIDTYWTAFEKALAEKKNITAAHNKAMETVFNQPGRHWTDKFIEENNAFFNKTQEEYQKNLTDYKTKFNEILKKDITPNLVLEAQEKELKIQNQKDENWNKYWIAFNEASGDKKNTDSRLAAHGAAGKTAFSSDWNWNTAKLNNMDFLADYYSQNEINDAYQKNFRRLFDVTVKSTADEVSIVVEAEKAAAEKAVEEKAAAEALVPKFPEENKPDISGNDLSDSEDNIVEEFPENNPEEQSDDDEIIDLSFFDASDEEKLEAEKLARQLAAEKLAAEQKAAEAELQPKIDFRARYWAAFDEAYAKTEAKGFKSNTGHYDFISSHKQASKITLGIDVWSSDTHEEISLKEAYEKIQAIHLECLKACDKIDNKDIKAQSDAYKEAFDAKLMEQFPKFIVYQKNQNIYWDTFFNVVNSDKSNNNQAKMRLNAHAAACRQDEIYKFNSEIYTRIDAVAIWIADVYTYDLNNRGDFYRQAFMDCLNSTDKLNESEDIQKGWEKYWEQFDQKSLSEETVIDKHARLVAPDSSHKKPDADTLRNIVTIALYHQSKSDNANKKNTYQINFMRYYYNPHLIGAELKDVTAAKEKDSYWENYWEKFELALAKKEISIAKNRIDAHLSIKMDEEKNEVLIEALDTIAYHFAVNQKDKTNAGILKAYKESYQENYERSLKEEEYKIIIADAEKINSLKSEPKPPPTSNSIPQKYHDLKDKYSDSSKDPTSTGSGTIYLSDSCKKLFTEKPEYKDIYDPAEKTKNGEKYHVIWPEGKGKGTVIEVYDNRISSKFPEDKKFKTKADGTKSNELSDECKEHLEFKAKAAMDGVEAYIEANPAMTNEGKANARIMWATGNDAEVKFLKSCYEKHAGKGFTFGKPPKPIQDREKAKEAEEKRIADEKAKETPAPKKTPENDDISKLFSGEPPKFGNKMGRLNSN